MGAKQSRVQTRSPHALIENIPQQYHIGNKMYQYQYITSHCACHRVMRMQFCSIFLFCFRFETTDMSHLPRSWDRLSVFENHCLLLLVSSYCPLWIPATSSIVIVVAQCYRGNEGSHYTCLHTNQVPEGRHCSSCNKFLAGTGLPCIQNPGIQTFNFFMNMTWVAAIQSWEGKTTKESCC